MWFRRVRFIDIRYHWSWRKCTIVLVILLIINTAFHWTLVDDVNSHTGQPDHQIAIAQSKGDDGPLFHDRVLSINKWFDDKSGGDDEERGLAFEAVNDHQAQQKEAHREPLITYITRKPSNRKPLGEALTKRRDHVTELLLERSENPEPEKFGNASPSSLDIVQNKSEMSIKVSESRKQIAHMREKLQTRKREVIKNKSVETREVVLPFLQNPQTKIRQATKLKINNEHDRTTKVIDTIQTIDLFAIVDIYLNEKIRYYSQPIWLNSEDISVMNLLAGSWILCRRPDPDLTSASDPSNPHLLLIANSEMGRMVDKLDDNGRKQGGKFDPDTGCDQAESTGCRTAWCSFDLSVVVAFHLDRVIGLNITPPSVARELPVGTRHPTAPLHAGGPSEPLRSKFVLDADLAVRTVALVVTSLDGANARRHAGLSETRDGDRGDSRKLTPATATTAEFSEELSEKLIIFCYLLKISNCSINVWADYFSRSRIPEDSAATEIPDLPCLGATGHSPVRVFRSPSASFDEGKHLLQRFVRVSRANRDLLQAGRIRQRLLQSLFVDHVFWTEAGGRRTIEDLLNVLDVRLKELNEWTSRFSRAAAERR